MGKKRGVHIVEVSKALTWASFFLVKFKRSKCRYAPARETCVVAKDELDAYRKVKEKTNG